MKNDSLTKKRPFHCFKISKYCYNPQKNIVIFHGDATLIFFCSKDQLNLLLQNQPKQIFIDGFIYILPDIFDIDS